MNAPRRAISISGLWNNGQTPWAAGPRGAMEWAVAMGFEGIVLDATMPGFRPRELDRSARRDLASVLRRSNLVLGGLDLWIPPAHFADAAHIDRAVGAVTATIELAAELRPLTAGAVPVHVVLPSDVSAEVVGAIVSAAELSGVDLADHAWPVQKATKMRIGVDPSAILSAGASVTDSVLALPSVPAAARLSDVSAGLRAIPGHGTLNVRDYEFALIAKGFAGLIACDLRGLPDAVKAARAMAVGER